MVGPLPRPSDHGEMALEHRQDFKNAMYEPAVRVPLIIAGYNLAAPLPRGVVVTNMTSHLDIYPTLVELGGGTIPPWLRGYSLAPFLATTGNRLQGSAFPRDYAVSEYHSNMGNTGAFMIRRGPWKYITFGRARFPWFANYTDILVNVDADAWELTNVIDQHTDIAAALHAQLITEFQGRGLDTIDAEAKGLDLQLYSTFYWQADTPSQLLTQFQRAYTGFDQGDAAKVQTWSGHPV